MRGSRALFFILQENARKALLLTSVSDNEATNSAPEAAQHCTGQPAKRQKESATLPLGGIYKDVDLEMAKVLKQFVSRHFGHIISGELVRLERSRPLLQLDAIATIFPNVPKYLSKPVPKKRNPKDRLDLQFAPPQKKSRINVASPDTSDEAPTLAANSGLPKCDLTYSVCLPGQIMSLLHAQKLVLFRGGDSMIEHQVFARGVELSLDEHCDPASLLQAVDSMKLCSGAERSVEFPLARSSNMTSWNEILYHTKCKGFVSRPEKCCIASK
ncbi:hypothetical protein HPB49_017389 [Dermacentor silvarum]|uniref:Uncharacterized protein n=1 Tax=Dermacentor silvarum TaxID=543639 RepID=A0ACB8E127_DERSI|nr:hypothetical protein HPB49_017389 [Dermacentor silvarum]